MKFASHGSQDEAMTMISKQTPKKVAELVTHVDKTFDMLEEHQFWPQVQSTYNPFPSPGVLFLFSSSLSVAVLSCS